MLFRVTFCHPSLSKNLRAFPPVFSGCRAHDLFAVGEQIPYIMEQLPLAIVPLDSLRDAPHLQPEKCFRPRTEGELPRRGKRSHPGVRRGRKQFEPFSLLTQRTLRGFFYSLDAGSAARVFLRPDDP